MMALAIRVKGTRSFLPNARGRSGRGFTHVEPTAQDFPRLFHRRQDAQAALRWWLEGKQIGLYDEEGCYDGNKVTPQAHRKADQMEIVVVVVELLVK